MATQTPKAELRLKIDPELARIALGLNRTGEYFVWCVGHHFFGQPGHTTKDRLFAKIQATGVITSRRHFNRLLKQGKGLFWNLDNYGHIYLRAYVKVSERLTQLAVDTQPQLVETNIPGARPVLVTTGGSLNHFKAQIYAGWLAYRHDPTIARDTLTTLFNCTKVTLLNWEQALGDQLRIVTNYAQTSRHPLDDERITDYIPAHSYNYVTQRGQTRIRWQQPNTYHTSDIQEHAHKGQSRKARAKAAKAAWYQPVEKCAHQFPSEVAEKELVFDRSHRIPKRYYDSPKSLQRFIKRQAKRGQQAITPQTPRYIYLGKDRNQHGIWELSLDGYTATRVNERKAIKAEFAWWKAYGLHLDIAQRCAKIA